MNSEIKSGEDRFVSTVQVFYSFGDYDRVYVVTYVEFITEYWELWTEM